MTAIEPYGISEDGLRPLYAGGVRAWRIWHCYNGKLFAIVQSKVWKRGLNVADGYESSGGFYGFRNIREAEMQEPDSWTRFNSGQSLEDVHRLRPWTSDEDAAAGRSPAVTVVIGSYIGWGRMKVGTRGMRAEYAVPEYILTPTDFDYAVKLLHVAENYRMTIITREQADALKTGIVPYAIPD